MYRQVLPAIGLSLECNTENVPNDGRYYVLKDGEVLASYKSLKKALRLFNEIKAKSGITPKTTAPDREKLARSMVETRLIAHELYWAESHKFRGRGGKGGRGGV